MLTSAFPGLAAGTLDFDRIIPQARVSEKDVQYVVLEKDVRQDTSAKLYKVEDIFSCASEETGRPLPAS